MWVRIFMPERVLKLSSHFQRQNQSSAFLKFLMAAVTSYFKKWVLINCREEKRTMTDWIFVLHWRMLGKLLENPGAASYLHQFYFSNRLSQTVSHANRHQYYTTDELMKDSWPLMGFNYLSTIPVNYIKRFYTSRELRHDTKIRPAAW